MTIEKAREEVCEIIKRVMDNKGKSFAKGYPSVIKSLENDMVLLVFSSYNRGVNDTYKEVMGLLRHGKLEEKLNEGEGNENKT